MILLALTIVGAPGTFTAVGDRLEALHGRELSGLARTSLGTMISVMSAWFPIIGWCFVIPALKLFAFGSGVLAVVGRFRRA